MRSRHTAGHLEFQQYFQRNVRDAIFPSFSDVLRWRERNGLRQAIAWKFADQQSIYINIANRVVKILRPFELVEPAQAQVALLEANKILATNEDIDVGGVRL